MLNVHTVDDDFNRTVSVPMRQGFPRAFVLPGVYRESMKDDAYAGNIPQATGPLSPNSPDSSPQFKRRPSGRVLLSLFRRSGSTGSRKKPSLYLGLPSSTDSDCSSICSTDAEEPANDSGNYSVNGRPRSYISDEWSAILYGAESPRKTVVVKD